MHEMQPIRGKVSGRGEVRGPDGVLKGYIEFEGTTTLTEDELRAKLALAEQPPTPSEEGK